MAFGHCSVVCCSVQDMYWCRVVEKQLYKGDLKLKRETEITIAVMIIVFLTRIGG
jgi:hypothetical protein